MLAVRRRLKAIVANPLPVARPDLQKPSQQRLFVYDYFLPANNINAHLLPVDGQPSEPEGVNAGGQRGAMQRIHNGAHGRLGRRACTCTHAAMTKLHGHADKPQQLMSISGGSTSQMHISCQLSATWVPNSDGGPEAARTVAFPGLCQVEAEQ